jgi:leader peptidase (prepilin peptidase)/N-methyltransferase
MNFIFAALLGLFAGLVVNYLADLLPTQRKLARPTCPECGKPLGWSDYFTFKACRACGKPRARRAYLTLAAGVVLALVLWVARPAWMEYWLALLLVAYLGLVIIIDIEHRLIMHLVTLAGTVLGVVTGLARFSLARTLLGGATGLLIMLALYGFGTLFARFRARRLGVNDGEEALGFGDVTLSTVLGLMLGFPNILSGLVTGILLAGVYSLALILSLVLRKKYETAAIYIAYGPFLVLGAAYYLFFR